MLALLIILAVTVAAIMVARWVSQRTASDAPPPEKANSDCCGAHAVCERETLLNTSNRVEYYDDEELDALKDINPADYTSEQAAMLADVFYTLQEKDVAGWLRSLQMRRIELPENLREEALLIVRERREQRLV